MGQDIPYICGECGKENKKNAYGYYFWKCHDCRVAAVEEWDARRKKND